MGSADYLRTRPQSPIIGSMTDVADIAAEPPAVPGAKDLGWALSTVLRWFKRDCADVVADLPGGVRGFTVLHVVAEGRCRNQAEIADALGIDRTVFTYLLDELEEARLVQRRPDPRDRRARQIVATERGLARLEELQVRVDAVQQEILDTLGERDGATFTGLLDRLAQHATSAGHDGGECEPLRR